MSPPVLHHPDLFHAIVLLNLLVVTGAWCLARPSYPAAAILTALGIAWLFWNGPLEGRILYSINLEHGLTESDLLSAIAFVIAGVTAWRKRSAS
ncbi:hypothetical protein [Gordonia sp. ABSL49_1]|uniref:hypothetical protein n=1 Tax=Gordonia sp. ABSL49_1 TaxID=2920941 RepID=UPI0027E31A28|nr:hypothetical protein [Gordonia sp. ABSL49_1]